LSSGASPSARAGRAPGWWNWQTRTSQKRLLKGMRVRVPLPAPVAVFAGHRHSRWAIRYPTPGVVTMTGGSPSLRRKCPHGGRYRALRRHGPVRRCGRRRGRFRGVRRGSQPAGRRAVYRPGAGSGTGQPHRIQAPPLLQTPEAVRRWHGAQQAGTLFRSAHCSRAAVTAPGEVSSHCGQIDAALSTAESREALRNPGDSIAVPQDLKCHFKAFEIVHGHQNGFWFPVPGERNPFMLQPYPPGQVRQVRLGLGYRDRGRCWHGHSQDHSRNWSEFKPTTLPPRSGSYPPGRARED
jgi:hypothetical protein